MTKRSDCQTCHRDSKRANSDWAECSHVDCPHRRRAWSERPRAGDNKQFLAAMAESEGRDRDD